MTLKVTGDVHFLIPMWTFHMYVRLYNTVG